MTIRKPHGRGPTRRDVIRTASAAGVAVGAGPFLHATPARAANPVAALEEGEPIEKYGSVLW